MINLVDNFIFYDDVNYIKNGWVNRNKMLLNGIIHTFTIPIKNQSSFAKINETYIDWDSNKIQKIFKTFKIAYSKKNKLLLNEILSIFEYRPETISELNVLTIKFFCEYLGIITNFYKSSDLNYNKKHDKVENLIQICNLMNSNIYINPLGGTKLYNKNDFKSRGIDLYFINGQSSTSILDFCMNNSKDFVVDSLKKYTLT